MRGISLLNEILNCGANEKFYERLEGRCTSLAPSIAYWVQLHTVHTSPGLLVKNEDIRIKGYMVRFLISMSL
jgi:hypothetical protein